MVDFSKSPSVANNTATNLLTIAIANGYKGTALADRGLTITAPDDADLYHGDSGVAASGLNKIAQGTSRTFQEKVDLSQKWIIHNAGSARNIGLEFVGFGVGV